MTPEQAALLRGELAYQNHIAAGPAYAALPRGPVHADLFRDNVMFEDGRLTGFFDFYFAGVDSWLFDIAVCLNDWAVELSTGVHDRACPRLRGCLCPCDRCPRPSASCCPPCCGPAPCASGSRACGTSTSRARPRCSSRTIPRTSNACCASGWPIRWRPPARDAAVPVARIG